MDEDEEDYIFCGTPIEREEETSARKRKTVAEAGQLRSLPPWKQEVRDEEGRKRFHGAFTGGYSAGYYNTVGSKEGWTPQTFTSSRKNRAEVKQQNIYTFLDDDEKAEMEGHSLETSMQFDTFGFTAAEVARRQAEKEQQKRPSAIPGPVPDEIVLPATNSIGVKLLLKMGWRHGHSIKDTRTEALYDARREARQAFLAFSANEGRSELVEFESNRSDPQNFADKLNDGTYGSQCTPVFVLNPKQDLHGLGYDPFKHAPEFRERKRLRVSGNKDRGTGRTVSVKGDIFASNSGKFAPGFGIGALEELDVEDEDIYASGFEVEGDIVEEGEQPSSINPDIKLQLRQKEQDVLSGFKAASNSDYNLERFHPPVVPPNFEPCHKFLVPVEVSTTLSHSPPPEVPAPEDKNLRLLIEGFATLVSRCGKLFEDLSKEKNKTNPLFFFLSGGNGHDYYVRKLWEEQQKHIDQRKVQVDPKSVSFAQKMTAEGRGRILGEKPLERSSNISSSSVAVTDVSHLQSNLSDTFTKPASLIEVSGSEKPFKNDPAKQERFEQFLKDKYQGGLRSTYTGTSSMSENDRARERLDFEAAAETIAKGESGTKTNPLPIQQFMELPLTLGRQFISGGVEPNQLSQYEEKIEKKAYPKREEFHWRPSPILCKRFDIIDPFMGKPLPLPRARSRMDSLIFMSDTFKTVKVEGTADVTKDSSSSSSSQFEVQESRGQITSNEPDVESNSTSVERPVDLYKAIFSDDSDDEEENTVVNLVHEPEKKTEGANTTLNRLIAGDFLQSLGKELGLDVPPDASHPSKKSDTTTSQKETVAVEDVNMSSGIDRSTPTLKSYDRVSGGAADATTGKSTSSSGKECDREVDKEVASAGREGADHSNSRNGTVNMDYLSGAGGSGYSGQKPGEFGMEKMEHQSRRHRTHSRRHRSRSSSSDTDSSSDRRSDSSTPRAEKRSSSLQKSRKKSKHHKHKSRKSSTRHSSHGRDRDHSDDRRESKKSWDDKRSYISSKSDGRRKYH